MASRMGRAEFEKLLAIAGLAVGTWAPGDGQKRYRFFESDRARYDEVSGKASGVHEDYHSGDGLFTALGSTEAVAYLRGYVHGRTRHPQDEPSTYRGYRIAPDPSGGFRILRPEHSGGESVMQRAIPNVAHAKRVIDAMHGD